MHGLVPETLQSIPLSKIKPQKNIKSALVLTIYLQVPSSQKSKRPIPNKTICLVEKQVLLAKISL